MPNEIQTKLGALTPLTITLASLANQASRQSTLESNAGQMPAALIHLRLRSAGSAPNANSVCRVHLIREGGDGTTTIRDDGAGTTNAAITIRNAPMLGAIVFAASTNADFYGIFDTWRFGPLGPNWGIAITNLSGQILNATEGNHVKGYRYYVPEVQ